MTFRDEQTIYTWKMLALDTVILLVSVSKIVRIYLFTSSRINYRKIEAKNARYCQELRCFYKSHPGTGQIDYSFGKHSDC